MVWSKVKVWAVAVKRDAHALYLAAGDPRVPTIAKVLVACVAAYAFSPIDLIPDFVPVLGYLDDIVIVPLGIMWAVRLIPPDVMAEHRASAEIARSRPTSAGGAAAIVTIWLAASVLIAWWAWRYVSE